MAESLFGGPLTTNYLVVASIIGFMGAYLTYSANPLPDTVRALVMMGTLLGLARLFRSRLMRWAWLGLMGLLGIIPLMDGLLLLT
ncbi:hypothetical protein D0T11_17845 [Hymenobacter rubripertinctus]|uniref:Uncharacterized protein n=1 Tax=Hymenobacter rubripertinctus TaxID=2029981 RepID=A0A418QP49_9BACT|nr:hypothetical protein D0T11_17845 [Hymenobacter rubripertinctus]